MDKITFFDRLGEILDRVMSFTVGSLTLGKLFSALLLLAVCLTGVKILMRMVDRLLQKGDIPKTLHTFIRSAAKVILLLLTFLLVAERLDIDVTSLITVMGVAGLAVSLALQDALSKLVGGMMLLAAKPFVVGDYIDAGANSGTVKEIGLVYTCLTTVDNKIVYLPNNDIAASRVINYSAQDKRRVDITVSASYGDDCEKVKQALREVLDRVPGILSEPEPFVAVSSYGESAIQYVVRAWTSTDDYWDVYFAITEQIRPAFLKHGIEMTYNHLNVHVKQD